MARQGRSRAQSRAKTRGTAAWLLFILPLPCLFAAVMLLAEGNPVGFLVNGLAYVFFALAGISLRRGLMNAEAPRSWRVPWKILGGLLVGGATWLTAGLAAGHGGLAGLAFGFAAWAGYHLLFGFDHLARAEAQSFGGYSAEELSAVLDPARERIRSIEAAGRQIRSIEFRGRLQNIAKRSGDIIGLIEEDPGDLRQARRFLNIYLDGVKNLADKFARAEIGEADGELEHRFRDLLVTMEETCEEQYEKLLSDDRFDLDVGLEVLSEQLKREGIG